MERNKVVQNDLPGELYTTEDNDEIPDNCKYPLGLIQAAGINQKQQIHRKFKNWCKIMLTVNIDIQDRLINSQPGNNRHIEFAHSSRHPMSWKRPLKVP